MINSDAGPAAPPPGPDAYVATPRSPANSPIGQSAEADMTPAPISYLVARYQLRRRADSNAFTEGIGLARRQAVTLELFAPSEVTATVRDPDPLQVRIAVQGDQLVGSCTCEVAAERICRHQVAVAHAVWVRDRRKFGRIH